MNIFFINSIARDVWGGGEKWMLTTANGLHKRGHSVYFCGQKNSLFLQKCDSDKFEILPLKIGGDFGPLNILKIASFLKQKNINIIIANFNKDVRLAGLAKKFSPANILIARNGLPIIRNKMVYKITYKKLADAIITNTQAIKKKYLGYGWMQDDFIKVIHNGIDVTQNMEFNRPAVLSKFNLPDQYPVVSIFGRLVGQKQHHLFLQVARNILDHFPKAIFLIVGDGPLKNKIIEQANGLDLSDHIKMLGHQTDVMPAYAISDLVLLTSKNEGLPNVVMEAMLATKPVVAFNVGGVSELILSDDSGIVVPPDDVQQMSKHTLRILQSKTLAKNIGSLARQHIIENFSVQKMIDEVEKFLLQKL